MYFRSINPYRLSIPIIGRILREGCQDVIQISIWFRGGHSCKVGQITAAYLWRFHFVEISLRGDSTSSGFRLPAETPPNDGDSVFGRSGTENDASEAYSS